MPGSTPIRNGTLQTALDLNSQSVDNKAEAFKLTPLNVGGTSYTLTDADAYKLISFTGDRTLHIPAGLSLPPGVEVACYSSNGSLTVSPSGGSTVYNNGDGLVMSNPYQIGSVICLATDEWLFTKK